MRIRSKRYEVGSCKAKAIGACVGAAEPERFVADEPSIANRALIIRRTVAADGIALNVAFEMKDLRGSRRVDAREEMSSRRKLRHAPNDSTQERPRKFADSACGPTRASTSI